MHDNQKKLQERIISAAQASLEEKQYVSPIDILLRLGWLAPTHLDEWRKGKIRCLEQVLNANLKKISFAMECFRAWAKEKALKPSITEYIARTRERRNLQFSVSGHPTIEQHYRTHYISPVLSENKQKKLQEKLNKSPDLIVYRIVSDSQCNACKKELHKGSLLFMQAEEPLCIACAGLDDGFEYLPAGDSTLTRRVKKASTTCAVVVEFSRSRKRYERQGLLVEKEALQKVQQELSIDDTMRDF